MVESLNSWANGITAMRILLAPLTAELIADAVAGKPSSREAQALSPHRFEEHAR